MESWYEISGGTDSSSYLTFFLKYICPEEETATPLLAGGIISVSVANVSEICDLGRWAFSFSFLSIFPHLFDRCVSCMGNRICWEPH